MQQKVLLSFAGYRRNKPSTLGTMELGSIMLLSDFLAINHTALFSGLLQVTSILYEVQELWLSKRYRIYPIGSVLQLMFVIYFN